ncbi:MAG: hypothetical protein ACI4E0_08120, partial [Blautia sp.]
RFDKPVIFNHLSMIQYTSFTGLISGNFTHAPPPVFTTFWLKKDTTAVCCSIPCFFLSTFINLSLL